MIMTPATTGIVVFACTFGAALFGIWLRSTVRAHLLDADSRDTMKLGIGLIVTMTALVLGLVTASAKNSFDAADTTVKHTATQLLALDRVLARYGPETGTIRKALRDEIGARIDMLWPQNSSKPVDFDQMASRAELLGTERLADAIQRLTPHDDAHRALQKRALDLAEELLQARWLVTSRTAASIPLLFLAVLLSWLTITFATFGLLAPRNATVVAVLFVCALSVGGAVFLVLEMDGPFDGILQVSSDPMRFAHEHLNQ